MARLIRRRYGRLGLQLALAFVFVAVGAVVAANVIAAMTVYGDARQLLTRQEASETSAAALGAAVIYPRAANTAGMHAAWARALSPVIAVAVRSGTSIQVRDADGRVVRSSLGYASFPPGPKRTAPVIVGLQRVGSVTLKFDDRGIGAIMRRYEAQNWHSRLGAAGFGALFALVVALLLAPMIAAPVDRLIWTARAMGSGRRDVRVGRIRGFRDIHELAATFDEMAERLDQQDQLRRDFVADISHELRAPIAVLRASTEGMLDHITEPTAAQIAALNDEAVRLGRMVDDLQRLAAAEAAAIQLTLAHCDLADLAADAADSLSNIFDQAGVRLERRLSPVHARCDRARMREVVTNLMTNAVKFTAAGGLVVLETRSSGGLATLRVSDSGVGIPPEEIPHVSERFYRGSGAAEISGSGIGLAIVAELVRGHHGTLDIASKPGEGTRVTVEIPAALMEASVRRK
jgi:signal transduction histidine kinase